MRNIKRGPVPDSLAANADQWLEELQEELAKGNRKDPKKVARLQNRYNQKDVREALKKMYSGLCCYCEAWVADVGAGQIEHLKAKERFPQYTFDWNNLHLICTACNRAKSNKWDHVYPILDPTSDTPIPDHLEYRCYTLNPRSERGKTTIIHPELNRRDLEDARRKVFIAAFLLLESMNRHQGPEEMFERNELQKMTNDQYGSLVKHVAATAHEFQLNGMD